MEKDKAIIDVLKSRCGKWSIVILENNQALKVFDIAWGYDAGDEWAHITTNISPGPAEKGPVDLISTSRILRILDEDGTILFNQQANTRIG